VRGILITEQRRHLENLYFVSPELMQTKLTTLARLKLLLCGAMFAMSLYELAQQAETLFALPAVNLMDMSGLMIGLGAALFLGHCARKSLSIYRACRHKSYLVQFYNESDAQLYSAAIAVKENNLQVTHTRVFDAMLAWY
jgi:hypothetical protein